MTWVSLIIRRFGSNCHRCIIFQSDRISLTVISCITTKMKIHMLIKMDWIFRVVSTSTHWSKAACKITALLPLFKKSSRSTQKLRFIFSRLTHITTCPIGTVLLKGNTSLAESIFGRLLENIHSLILKDITKSIQRKVTIMSWWIQEVIVQSMSIACRNGHQLIEFWTLELCSIFGMFVLPRRDPKSFEKYQDQIIEAKPALSITIL